MDFPTVTNLLLFAAAVLVPVAGAVLTMHWKISNISTRLEAVERAYAKRDEDHDCLDKKVDEIKIELAKIETKLDILLVDKA